MTKNLKWNPGNENRVGCVCVRVCVRDGWGSKNIFVSGPAIRKVTLFHFLGSHNRVYGSPLQLAGITAIPHDSSGLFPEERLNTNCLTIIPNKTTWKEILIMGVPKIKLSTMKMINKYSPTGQLALFTQCVNLVWEKILWRSSFLLKEATADILYSCHL